MTHGPFCGWLRGAAAVLVLASPLVSQCLPDNGECAWGPYLQLGAPESLVVRWKTCDPTTSRVTYGPSPWALVFAEEDVATSRDHEIKLEGLSPDTRYFYTIGTTTGVLVGGTSHFFTTAPAVGAERPFRVWVLGDSGICESAGGKGELVRDGWSAFTGSRGTDLWLMLGDNAGNDPVGNELHHRDAVFLRYPDVLRTTVLWPTTGNHDLSLGAPGTEAYYAAFTLPTAGEAGGVPSGTEAWYSFDWGNAHFVTIDSDEGELLPMSDMLLWIQDDLLATTQDWIIAFFHHPPYSKSQAHDSDVEQTIRELRENVVPILEDHGVDLVLSGHSHTYERSMLINGHYGLSGTFDPLTMAIDAGDGRLSGDGAYRKSADRGAVYVVAGTGSYPRHLQASSHPVVAIPQPGPVGPCAVSLRPGPSSITALEDQPGSLALDFHGPQLDVRFIDENGVVRDDFTILKGGVTPVPLAPMPVTDAGWRYGCTAPTGWAEPGFDDSSWTLGDGGFGQGSSGSGAYPVETPLTCGSGNTSYFRRSFEIDHDLDLITNLRLTIRCDAGFVAYLNGNEVAKGGVSAVPPEPAGDGCVWGVVDLSSHRSLLVSGSNVLAVAVEQTTEDVFFQAALDHDAFVSLLGPCASGEMDLLRVNGSDGGLGRSVDAVAGAPMTVEVLAPAPPESAWAFVVFGLIGTASREQSLAVPDVGLVCFTPRWLDPVDPYLFCLATSLPPSPCCDCLVQATAPPPWVWTLPGGVPTAGQEYTLQGAVLTASFEYEVTNAVRIRSVMP